MRALSLSLSLCVYLLRSLWFLHPNIVRQRTQHLFAIYRSCFVQKHSFENVSVPWIDVSISSGNKKQKNIFRNKFYHFWLNLHFSRQEPFSDRDCCTMSGTLASCLLYDFNEMHKAVCCKRVEFQAIKNLAPWHFNNATFAVRKKHGPLHGQRVYAPHISHTCAYLWQQWGHHESSLSTNSRFCFSPFLYPYF